MAGNVVRVSLLADAKGFKKGFNEAEKATTGFEKTASAVGGAIKGFFAVQAAGAVVAFAKDSIRAFSEAEQAAGSVESVFGSAADGIIESSRTAAQEFGLSASEFNESASLIGSMLQNQMGLSAEEAAGKVDDLIGKASDMAATFGGTTSDAISAIGSLLRGERDPIEKYGVSMNDAAISANALEEGLVGATGEVDASAKAASALDLLYDQTADSAGQFAREADTVAGKQARLNAQLENNKALVGQALQGAYKTAMPVIGGFGDLLGEMSLNFLELTGNMESAEATLIRMGEKWTEAETPLEKLIAMTQQHSADLGHWSDQVDSKFTSSANDLAAGLGLTVDELELMLELVPQVSREQEFVAGAQDVWTEAIKRAIKVEQQKQLDLQRGRGREEEYAAALKDTKDAQDDAADATYDHIGAIRELRDEIRSQTDPMFAYQDAFADLEAAQRDVITAEKDYGKGSPEHIDALNKSRDAALDFKDAELTLAEQGGVTTEELKTHLRSLRIYTEDQIDLMIGEFNRIDAFKFNAKTIRITHQVTGGGYQRQLGGPVMPNTPYLVGERGPEVFEPSTGGRIIPNSGVGGHMGGGGGGTLINITINAGFGTDPSAVSRAVVEALQRYQRQNGHIPIRIRA